MPFWRTTPTRVPEGTVIFSLRLSFGLEQASGRPEAARRIAGLRAAEPRKTRLPAECLRGTGSGGTLGAATLSWQPPRYLMRCIKQRSQMPEYNPARSLYRQI